MEKELLCSRRSLMSLTEPEPIGLKYKSLDKKIVCIVYAVSFKYPTTMRWAIILLLGCSFGSKKKGEVSATISDEEKFWCRKNPGSKDSEQLAVFPFKKAGRLQYEPYVGGEGGPRKCLFDQGESNPQTVDDSLLEECKPCESKK